MTRRYSLPAPPEAPAPRLRERLARYLFATWPGRILVAALGVWVFEAVVGLPEPLAALDALLLIAFGAFPLARWLIKKLLWRIRTKLIVSYLFIAVVPVLLLVLFFLIAGLIALTLVGSYMVAGQLGRSTLQLEAVAQTAVAAVDPAAKLDAPQLGARLQAARTVHPSPAFTLLRGTAVVVALGDAPRELPPWIRDKGRFAGFVRVDDSTAVLRVVSRQAELTLLLQVPVDEHLAGVVEERTGLRLTTDSRRLRGRAERREDREPGIQVRLGPPPGERAMHSVAIVDAVDWKTGNLQLEPLPVTLDLMKVIERLSPASRELSSTVLVQALGVVGAFFLVVYCVALGVGLLLARSITRGVHELSKGTEGLRRGDLDTFVKVTSRDQLGELAESFNVMASGLRDLMRENAEKQRLEEELRIARQIQMSLLPQGAVSLPGLRIAALCLPAAEVGGDYYDLLPLSPTRMGVLVADVSGKGTSAALYMAELKGLILSLSRIHESPARLLQEANSILAANLDSRSFITMTYAVADVEKRTLRYARAGHSPILQLEAASGRTRVLAPSGLGLGIDRGDTFDRVLEEACVPLASGDIFLFFTDGLSEAMNLRSELFGERRLRDLLEQGESLSSEELKERILAEIQRFAEGAAQHDDLTLVILKVV
ncbi:MAG: PP2C family protein-serine/threonine phosphatase [Vicinamibacteria bacterium]